MQTSYSDMQRFMSCPRSWYFGTYRRLRRRDEPPVGPLPFGARIHTALELWEEDEGRTDIKIIWDTLMMYEYEKAAGGFTDGLDKENKLGRAMLEGYAEWSTSEAADWETLGIEAQLKEVVTLEVDGVVVDILVRGKLDRRSRRLSDGAIFINDYKTVGNFGEPTILGLEMSPQGRLYMLLEASSDRNDPWVAGIVYTLLRKVLRTAAAKPPFYKRLVIPISHMDLMAYRFRLIGILNNMIRAKRDLDSGMDHRIATPFHPSWQCATCPFKLPCAEYQATGKAAAENMLEDLYVVGDPFERYTDDREAV